MYSFAEFAGRLVPVLLIGWFAAYFFVRGLGHGPRSRRLANLSLFCGCAALVLPEVTLGLSPATRPGLFLASGAARMLVGMVGAVLAIAGFVSRRDGGVGLTRPVVAAGVSLLAMLFGASLLMFASFGRPASPWVYSSPDGVFRLTLPSSEWVPAPTPGASGGVAFVRSFPRMQAKVLHVKRDQTEADFEHAAEAFRQQIETIPALRGHAEFRHGTNASGNSYRYWTGTDSSRDGQPVFVAYSVTWYESKRNVIEVLFEGLPTMRSEAGKAAEMGTIEKSAETICLSVE
ncbi:MAG: hypothetical protein ACKO3G_16225 [Planctomycetaceae bacterium]